MASIEINESLWNGVSDEEKAQIIEHLKKHRLLRDADTIVGNPSIAEVATELSIGDLNPGKVLCQVACNAAAAAAAAALTLTGPGLAAALAAIAVAREACVNSC
jgi:hypothetical protein